MQQYVYISSWVMLYSHQYIRQEFLHAVVYILWRRYVYDKDVWWVVARDRDCLKKSFIR